MSFVAEHQRNRIVRATLEAAARKGFASISVADIIAEAGVSRSAFYKLFDNKLDAFAEAIDRTVAELRSKLAGRDDPLDVLAEWASTEASAALCILVEMPAADPERYVECQEEAVAMTGLPAPLGLMVVGAVAAIFAKALTAGEPIDMAGLYAFVIPHFQRDAVAG